MNIIRKIRQILWALWDIPIRRDAPIPRRRERGGRHPQAELGLAQGRA